MRRANAGQVDVLTACSNAPVSQQTRWTAPRSFVGVVNFRLVDLFFLFLLPLTRFSRLALAGVARSPRMVLLTPGSQSPVRKRYRRRILDEDRIAALESRARTRREPSLSPRRLTLHPEESVEGGQGAREAAGNAGVAGEGERGGLNGERSEGLERGVASRGVPSGAEGLAGYAGCAEQAERGGEAGPAPRAKSPLRTTSTDSTLTPQSSTSSDPVVSNRRSERTQPSAKNLGPVPDPLKVARVLSPHVKGKDRARSEDDLPTSMEQLLNVLPRTRTTIKSRTPGKKRDLRVDPFASPVPSLRPRQPGPRASALFRRAQESSDEEELWHNYLGAADLAGMSSKTKTRYVERAAGGYLRPLVFDSEEASDYVPSDEDCEVKKKARKRKRAKEDAGHDNVKRLKKGEAAKGDFIRRTEQTAFAPLLARQARPAPKAAHRRAKPLARKNTVSGLGDQVSRATGLRIKRSARANQEKPAGRCQTLDSRRQPLEFGCEEEAGDVAPSAIGCVRSRRDCRAVLTLLDTQGVAGVRHAGTEDRPLSLEEPLCRDSAFPSPLRAGSSPASLTFRVNSAVN